MAKILNLDALSPQTERKLQLKGVTYDIREMAVSDFIAITQAADDIEKKSMAEQFQITLDLIRRQIPDLPEDAVQGMSVEKLQAVAAFVRGVEIETIMKAFAETAAEVAEAEGK